MNRQVNAISGRLSLRPPQRRSLEILDRITEISPTRKDTDAEAALVAIRHEFPAVTDFERDFPSLCFALATGVGKTRLMGAFVSYLHLAHGINNFFVLAPNLTIYSKLIADFTPNTPKYVFRGIAEFATTPPAVITGDNYENQRVVAPHPEMKGQMVMGLGGEVHINIFNISKINSEVRGGKSPRIKRLSEYIGQSYFDYLAGLPDLVLIMDESHRYRASAGVRAINDLRPILGLELTATPFVETTKGPIQFKNVIYDYPLAKAMADGFVKEPAVVTRKNFNPAGMSVEEIEQLKLDDGVRLHEGVKVELETYARETGNSIVKPFVLVIARDIAHAAQLLQLIKSDKFFEGRYRDKVIQVDSSTKGSEEDEETVQHLLKVEQPDDPTEVVIHVNMLKEGWDVTNLYTIVPLRAANARTLIEQSIGRGLRLPYGRRTGVVGVDRLNIIAHDKFQEIIDEANRPDSLIRVQAVVLDADELATKTVTVISQSQAATRLGISPEHSTTATTAPFLAVEPMFRRPEDQRVAWLAYDAIRKLEDDPKRLPTIDYLQNADIQASIARDVAAEYRPSQLTIPGVGDDVPDIAKIVAATTDLVRQQTIDIPRILVVPKGEVKSGFKPFKLNLTNLSYQSVSDELWVQHLRTTEREIIALGRGSVEEARLEDYVVSGLVDFDDISYDDHSGLLYNLAEQVVQHFRGYLSEEETRKVLRCHQRDIARFVHAQMQEHYWEDEKTEYEVKISKGFTVLKDSAYCALDGEPLLDFRHAPEEKSNMARYLFGGFKRCLYSVQKFQSDSERRLSVVLDRDALRWFKPARGQFQIFYRAESEHLEYQPDFVAEMEEAIYIFEMKARKDLATPDVEAKRDAAVKWCKNASDHSATYNGKPWRYVLVPHDEIAENMTVAGLVERFQARFE